MPFTLPNATAQENWAADDNALEARKIERYQQLVDQSPEKSYAFNQLMATVGKGAQYQKLLLDYEKKVAAKPQNFNLRMVLGPIRLTMASSIRRNSENWPTSPRRPAS